MICDAKYQVVCRAITHYALSIYTHYTIIRPNIINEIKMNMVKMSTD